MLHELKDDTFDDELSADTESLWLIDFWADWCPPCLALHPIIEELASEAGSGVSIGRIDTTANPEVAKRFDVQTLPTILIMSKGSVVKRMLGAKTKRQLLYGLSEARGSVASSETGAQSG
jgi:thioredoxin 1